MVDPTQLSEMFWVLKGGQPEDGDNLGADLGSRKEVNQKMETILELIWVVGRRSTTRWRQPWI